MNGDGRPRGDGEARRQHNGDRRRRRHHGGVDQDVLAGRKVTVAGGEADDVVAGLGGAGRPRHQAGVRVERGPVRQALRGVVQHVTHVRIGAGCREGERLPQDRLVVGNIQNRRPIDVVDVDRHLDRVGKPARVGQREGDRVVAGLAEVGRPLERAGQGVEGRPRGQVVHRQLARIAVGIGARDREREFGVFAAVLRRHRRQDRRQIGVRDDDRERRAAGLGAVAGRDGDRVAAGLPVGHRPAEFSADRIERRTGRQTGRAPRHRVAVGVSRLELQVERSPLGDRRTGNRADDRSIVRCPHVSWKVCEAAMCCWWRR